MSGHHSYCVSARVCVRVAIAGSHHSGPSIAQLFSVAGAQVVRPAFATAADWGPANRQLSRR